MVCSFFGHRDVSDSIEPLLYRTVCQLIEDGVVYFQVGNQGFFDSMVLRVLRRAQEEHPHIGYVVVLAYLPKDNVLWTPYREDEAFFPEELMRVHPRYAISKRNCWMIQRSDVVVTYIVRPYGGAARAAEYATKQGTRVINLAEIEE